MHRNFNGFLRPKACNQRIPVKFDFFSATTGYLPDVLMKKEAADFGAGFLWMKKRGSD